MSDESSAINWEAVEICRLTKR